jgi:hypothetical protein
MHKEEFYTTLLEDRFISFLIKQIKVSAKDGNMEEILKLIENLEHDFIPNKNNNNNSSKVKNYSNNDIDNSNINNKRKEMTRFSSFLDLQLKEILDRQNALEKQIITLKTNSGKNNSSNINNITDQKNVEIYSKTEKSYNRNNINNINKNKNNNSNYIKSLDNEYETLSKISNDLSHSIIKECNHHFNSKNYCKSINSISHNNYNNNNNQINENIKYVNDEKNLKNQQLNCREFKININAKQVINNPISKTMLGNFNKNNQNYSTIDELVNYIETNDNENKKKKNKKKIKNSKKKNSSQNKSPSIINKNTAIIDESVVENFRKKIYNDSEMSYQIRKIKPALSLKWLKSIDNI